jgi:molybdenum cofactor cytidylyltransferase
MPFEEHSVSLIATELAQLKSSVMDKTARILDRRLAMCGNHLAREFRVAHSVSTLSEALLEIMTIADSAPKLIIVFGASAVIDDNDVIPAAIREAGGHVLRVGMPVDPGNLMVLGQIGICYVIGAPGCARSPKENGFDWILERILAGERPDADDVARMGVGGLLMEVQMRQLPRQASLTPKVAIVLLAAGMATRMGVDGGHKLLAEFDGMPLIRRSALVAQNSNAASTVVVVGHREGDMRAVLSGLPMRLIANPEYASGVASSLGAGFAAVADEDPDGVLVMLADMPRVTSDDLNRLISAFQCAGGSSVVRAVSKGKRGNPVILPRSLNDAIFRLEGDVGARHLIEMSGLAVIDVEIGAAAHVDVDTLEAVIAAGGKPAKV